MIRPNIRYLAFDDRKLILLGIPIVTLAIPFLFYGVNFTEYLQIIHREFFESLTYTTIYWLTNRELIIQLRKKYVELHQAFRRIRVHLLIVFLLPFIISPTVSFLFDILYDFLNTKDLFEPKFSSGLIGTYFLTFSIMILYEAIYFFYKYKAAILEKEQIQRAHIQGQLDNLRNQINPHFLFNSLNTLMNLIPTDSDRAMSYLSKLSKFYRYTVSNQEQTLVPLTTELDSVRIYADLLKERFHHGIHIDIPSEADHSLQILPLCLQLLIENAVKHNIVSNKKPLYIHLRIHPDGQYLEVKNNIQKKIQEVSSTGMGLKNIKKRVAFFTKAPLLVNEADGYFTVSVPLIHS